MDLNNLFAIVTTTGDDAIIRRGAVKAEYYREKTEIRAMQATRDILKSHGIEILGRFHDRYLRAWFKHKERLRHLYRAAIRFTAEWLHPKGIEKCTCDTRT